MTRSRMKHSDLVFGGLVSPTEYRCLAKGGVRMLTRTALSKFARHKILVVGVGPGAVTTPINLSTMQDQPT